MKPGDFKRWRRAMGFKQKDAAEALGLKKRMIQYYEKGDRDGRKVTIPLTVALACYAVARGVRSYDASELPAAEKARSDGADRSLSLPGS